MLWWTLQKLRSDNPGTRKAAVEALGRIGDTRACETLLATALRDEDERVWQAAITALASLAAVEPLLEASDKTLRARTAEVLGELRDTRAIDPLVRMLKDREVWPRHAAAEALQSLQWTPVNDYQRAVYALAQEKWADLRRLGGAAVEPLLEALDTTWQWRNSDHLIEAIRLLGTIADQRAVPPLIAMLRHYFNPPSYPAPRVRGAAAAALGEIQDARAVEPLLLALVKCPPYDNHELELESGRALIRFGHESIGPLVGVLKSDNHNLHVHVRVLRCLAKIGDKRAVEPIVAWAQTKPPERRAEAEIALGWLGDVRGIPALLQKWCSSGTTGSYMDWNDSDTVKRLLAKFGREAIEPLVETLKDRDRYVREQAAAMLATLHWRPQDDTQRALWAVTREAWEEAAQLGAASVLPLATALRGLIDREYVGDSEKMEGIARALATIGDPGAVGPVVEVLVHKRWPCGIALDTLRKIERGGTPNYNQTAVALICTLVEVLKTAAGSVPLQDLRAAVSLKVTQEFFLPYPDGGWGLAAYDPIPLDCSKVSSLAQQELARRGLAVC